MTLTLQHIKDLMPVETKVTTTWQHVFTTRDGTSITVAGTKGSGHVSISIYEPATGFGMSESPSSRAETTMSWEDWNEFAKLIGGHQ